MKTRAAAEVEAPPAGPTDNSPTPAPASARPSKRVRRLDGRKARSLVAIPRPWTGPLDVADPGTMVGRQAELARLKQLWTEAQAGATRTALIAGEPGAGKTRLAAELVAAVEPCGARVLVGRCRRDGALPYEPIVDALAPAVLQQSDGWLRAHVSRHGPALARLIPELNGRLDGAVTDAQIGGRAQLLASVTAAVTSLGRPPVLLVLEDLHWATRSTVLVLDHLIRTCSSAPLFIVGTYRDAAIHPSHPLAELLDGPQVKRVTRMVLGNLSIQSVSALLVDRSTVAGKAAVTLARDLWRTTEGNPLLLTEVIRDLAAGGGLATGTIKTETVEKLGVAHEIAELTARRLGRPSSATRKAVEAASVVGPSFSVGTVALLTGEKPEDAARALAKAVRAAVIVPIDGKPGDYRFAHDRFGDAAYDFLAPNRRVRLHHDLATSLAGSETPTPPAVLVHHLAGAAPVGQSPEAVRHARRAGEAAAAMLAYEEAAAFYGQALAFLGGGGDPGQRADLLMLLGDANHRAAESARARQSYLQAAAVARAHKDGPRLGRAVLGLGEVLGVWGADGELIGLLDEAVAANPDDASLKAKLIARLAQARAAFDSPDQRKAQSDKAWELAWDSKDPDTMGAVLRSRHEALSAPDDLEDRAEIDGELWAMANNAQDTAQLLLAYGWRLVDLLEQGHMVDADRDRKLHAQLARRTGDARHLRDAAMWSATWALVEGRARQALTQTDKALALGQQARDPEATSIYWMQQLDLLLDWGGDGEVDGLVDVWRDLVRSHDQHPSWRASLALLLARMGDLDAARRELDDLLADDGVDDFPVDRTWVATMAAIGEVAAELEDVRCAALGKLLWPYSRRLIVVGPGHVCRGSVARVLGLLAGAADDWTAAERHFQAALSAHDRINAKPLLARTRYDFGRSLARKRGGPLHTGRVKTTLEQAAEEAEHLGLVRLAAQARAERAGLT